MSPKPGWCGEGEQGMSLPTKQQTKGSEEKAGSETGKAESF